MRLFPCVRNRHARVWFESWAVHNKCFMRGKYGNSLDENLLAWKTLTALSLVSAERGTKCAVQFLSISPVARPSFVTRMRVREDVKNQTESSNSNINSFWVIFLKLIQCFIDFQYCEDRDGSALGVVVSRETMITHTQMLIQACRYNEGICR